MKRRMLMLAALALTTAILLSACSGKETPAANAAPLRFSEATSYESLSALNGKVVSITGYMATLSPVSGKYMYLMNLPYQSCPFCVPNSTQLANTMAVYAPSGKSFAYTDQAIRVSGKLELGDYTDEYGYVYNYRIVDAAYEIIDLSDISDDYKLWYAIAEDGIVADLSAMFDYLYFCCNWPEYTVSYTDESGKQISYNLYPGDAENYFIDDGINGYAAFADDGYFPGLIARIHAISADALTELSNIVVDAHILEQYARGELSTGNYSYSESEDRYHLNNSGDLVEQFDAIYARFGDWLTKWQL